MFQLHTVNNINNNRHLEKEWKHCEGVRDDGMKQR